MTTSKSGKIIVLVVTLLAAAYAMLYVQLSSMLLPFEGYVSTKVDERQQEHQGKSVASLDDKKEVVYQNRTNNDDGDYNTTTFVLTDQWLRQCAKETQLNDTKGIIKPFTIEPGYELYRLGDCITLCKGCSEHYKRDGPAKAKDAPVGSMSYEYGRLACTEERWEQDRIVLGGDFKVVEDLLDRRRKRLQQMGGIVHRNNGTRSANTTDNTQQQQNYSGDFRVPDDNTLVIHLRLGDMIEGSGSPTDEMLIQGASPRGKQAWRGSIKSAYEILDNVKEANLRKVSIVGGSHMPNQYKKSRVYATCLGKAIQTAGYVVDVHMDGTNPDQDFFYMVHAKKFVETSGGFSRLIARLVEYHGGTVVGRTFQLKKLKNKE